MRGIRILPDGSMLAVNPSRHLISEMDSKYQRIQNEYRWAPSISLEPYTNLPKHHCIWNIIGDSDETYLLSAGHFPDQLEPILCIDNAFHIIEQLGLPNPIYGIQLRCKTYPGTGIRLLDKACQYLYPGEPCYGFSHKEFGTLHAEDTSIVVARGLGATGFRVYALGIKSPFHNVILDMKRQSGECNIELCDRVAINSKANTGKVAIMRFAQGVGVIDKFMNATMEGLKCSGYGVIPTKGRVTVKPSLICVWNGIRGSSELWLRQYSKVKTLYLEHGFIERQNHTQIDTKGFLHRASWAYSFEDPLPSYAITRLHKLCEPKPVLPRSKGYILILGQVDGDSQLFDSEIKTVQQLIETMSRVIPKGVEAIFRPHPKQRVPTRGAKNISLSTMHRSDSLEYNISKGSTTIEEALAGARFAVAINSNGLLDATIAGVPCLAFGPSLGINANVYHATDTDTLDQDIEDMLDGWCPDPMEVDQYLGWLACRQYATHELCRLDVMDAIINNRIPDL